MAAKLFYKHRFDLNLVDSSGRPRGIILIRGEKVSVREVTAHAWLILLSATSPTVETFVYDWQTGLTLIFTLGSQSLLVMLTVALLALPTR